MTKITNYKILPIFLCAFSTMLQGAEQAPKDNPLNSPKKRVKLYPLDSKKKSIRILKA